MPLSRTSIRSFLSTAHFTLEKSILSPSPVTFVIGNESADLDSLCSAIVLAYLRTFSSQTNTFYIPLSNLSRADLALRPELRPVLNSARLASRDLITLSDLSELTSESSRLPPERTRWLLVDHNALQGELGKAYESRVVGCIDHHDEENKVPQRTGDEPRIVRKSGSCMSLVVQHCKDAWTKLSQESASESTLWDVELAQLALAPILIDTTNLTSKDKVTPVDLEAAEFLTSLIKKGKNDFSPETFFNEVSEAKSDIGDLSLFDIFRKDYKQWTENGLNLGISSVVKNVDFLLDKAGDQEAFSSAIQQFSQERDLSIFSIMTTSTNAKGEFRRELLLSAINQKAIKAAKTFAEDATSRLGLESWGEGALDLNRDDHFQRTWWQKRVENSRKQVAPLMRASLRGSNL